MDVQFTAQMAFTALIEPVFGEVSQGYWEVWGPLLSIALVGSVCTLVYLLWQLRQRSHDLRNTEQELRVLTDVRQKDATELHRLNSILDHIPHFIWTTSPEGKLTYCNPFATDFVGLSFEQLQERGWEATIHPEDLPNTQEVMQEALEKKACFSLEHRVHHARENSWQWFLIEACPLLDEHGEVIEWAGFATNINELRRNQQKLVEARNYAETANRAKSEFLAVMNHELRTPLNAMIGTADLMMSEAQDEQMRKSLGVINQSGNQLLHLITDILSLSRIDSGKVKVEATASDLVTFIDRNLTPARLRAEEKGLAFSFQTEPNFPDSLELDPRIVFQVLSNLVNNAVKFTENGRVEISLSWQEMGLPDHGLVMILITDTGPGIPLEFQPKIFSPFEQADMSSRRNYEGTGLGLAIAKNLASILDGDVELIDSSPMGSEFAFCFPSHRTSELIKDPEEPAFSSPEIGPEQTPCRILMVEDDLANSSVLGLILDKFEFHHDHADTGEKAIAMSAETPYDIILMDVWLPGMDGIETTQKIREQESNHRPVIVALTAHAMENNRETCLASGMDHFLTKPVRISDLEILFSEILRRPCNIQQSNSSG